MKKNLAILLVILSLTTIFTGCGAPEETNESEIGTATEVYEAFISGVMNANVNISLDYLEMGKSYSLNDLVEAYSSGLKGDSLPSELTEKKYAYIDCGKDGKKELLLQFTFAEKDTPSYITYVILKNIAGDLAVIDSEYTYYRFETDINKFGYIEKGGYANAASYISETYFIDSEGQKQYVLGIENIGGFSEPVIPSNMVPESISGRLPNYELSSSDISYQITACWLTDPKTPGLTEDELKKEYIFYAEDNSGKGVEFSEENKELYDELGIIYVNGKTLEKEIKNHKKDLGLTKKVENGGEPKWVILE